MFFLTLTSATVQAQIYKRATQPTSNVNYGGGGSSYGAQHAVSGALGFYSPGNATWVGTANGSSNVVTPRVSGLFGIGGDYEYLWSNDFTLGGIFRYYSTSDSLTTGATTTEETVRLWTLGGMAKAYYHASVWSAYFGTGFGVLAPTYKLQTGTTTVDTEISTGFGFYLAVGWLFRVNEQIGIGVENLRAMSVGEKMQGWAINDFMFKGRFTF